MPIAVTCPNGHALNLDSKYSGKRIRCNKCQAIFLVDGEAVTASAPAPKPPPVPADNGFADELDDEDRPSKRRRDEEEEEDEDDDDRPRKRRRDEEDEDEEDDDRPSKRRRRDEDDDDDDDDDEDDDDRGGRSRNKAKETREQMRSLASGLTMFGWRFVMLAAFYGGLVAAIIMMLLGGLAPRIAGAFIIIAFIFSLIALLCYIASSVLGIIGAFLAMKIPPKSGIRGLAIANVACECTFAVLLLIHIIMSIATGGARGGMMMGGQGGMAPGMDGGAAVVGLLLLLVGLAGFVVFMIMLRLTALFVKTKSAAKTAIVLMIVGIATPTVGFLLAFVMIAIAIRAGPAVGILGLAILIGLCAAMAFIMVRIRGLCVAIGDKVKY